MSAKNAEGSGICSTTMFAVTKSKLLAANGRVPQNRLIHVDANQEWDFAEAGPLFLQGHFVRRHYLPATSYIQPPGDTVKTPGQKARVMHLGVSYIQSQSSCNCQFPFSPKIHRGVPNCVPEFERE